MPSPYKEIPITFEKGLVTEIDESVLDIGQASALENWEPAANGALRSRNRWSPITTTGLTAPYSVRGFGAIATGTAVAGAVSAPVVVQSSHWPNGDADPVSTKTVTLNGVNIGNVLVAIVTDNSDLTPTGIPAGWTQRAVSTGDKQHVKFYTHTADTSTEVFTYTITQARIRSVTVYEIKYLDSEDPGTKWAAQSVTSVGGGTDNLTVTATDTDGGLALVGYLYDGGTPNSSASGTAGYATPTLDNTNTRTGVTFQDLDQLDGETTQAAATSIVYTTPSWTPPSTGLVIVLIVVIDSTGINNHNSLAVSGNGMTWHDARDAGELGMAYTAPSGGIATQYAWADCSAATPTTGAITVTHGSAASQCIIMTCHFVLAIGGDTSDPFIQNAAFRPSGDGTDGPLLASALRDGSGILGMATAYDTTVSLDTAPIAVIGAGNWQSTLDSSNPTQGTVTPYMRSAYASSAHPPDTKANWTFDVSSFSHESITWEIGGAGNASRHYRDGLTGAGSVIEGFTYIANKEMTAKMVVWGYTPPTVQPDSVDFYIVMAVATSATTYKIYRIPRDDILSGTWELIDTVTDASSSEAFISFAQGAGYLIWTASTLNYPRSIELATLSASNITDMLGLAGRTAAYHKDRMFIAGSSQNPSRVYFSDIGLPLDYATSTDYLDIGGDDGEAIQDLSSVEGLLLIPKTNRAYLVSGSGIESFFVNELSGGTAATGRSAIRTPYGTLLSGEDDVWVVQGGGVDPMSRPLGGNYEITGVVSSAYAQDSALIVDSATERVRRVNLVTGAWSDESVNGDAGVYIVFSLNGRMYYGTDDSTTSVGGTRKLSDVRTYDSNTGGTHFEAATGRLALLGPSVKYTPRWLFIQSRNHAPTLPNTLFVDIESDHGTTRKAINVRSATQRDRIDIPGEHQGSEWIKLSFTSDSSAIAGAIDPERIVLGVDVEAPR